MVAAAARARAHAAPAPTATQRCESSSSGERYARHAQRRLRAARPTPSREARRLSSPAAAEASAGRSTPAERGQQHRGSRRVGLRAGRRVARAACGIGEERSGGPAGNGRGVGAPRVDGTRRAARCLRVAIAGVRCRARPPDRTPSVRHSQPPSTSAAPGLLNRSRAAPTTEVRCAARGRPCRRHEPLEEPCGGEATAFLLIGRWQGGSWKRRLPAPGSSATAGCARAAAASKATLPRLSVSTARGGAVCGEGAPRRELGTRMAHPPAVSPVARTRSRAGGGA